MHIGENDGKFLIVNFFFPSINCLFEKLFNGEKKISDMDILHIYVMMSAFLMLSIDEEKLKI